MIGLPRRYRCGLIETRRATLSFRCRARQGLPRRYRRGLIEAADAATAPALGTGGFRGDQRRGLIEAGSSGTSAGRSDPIFRDINAAASLKPVIEDVSPDGLPDFRGVIAAASLKHCGLGSQPRTRE
jgi:hypothetical protein